MESSSITKDKRLPKAPWFKIQIQWFWFGHLIGAIGKERRYWPRFRMSTRGANYYQTWVGPISLMWRRPWLYGPARQHLKEKYGNYI